METRRRRNITLGVVLIVLGVLFLLNNLDVIYVQDWWPILLIILGVGFFIGWVTDRRQSGLLMPAGILLVIGCQFLFLHASWPIYVLAPAIGFWLMYLLGESTIGLLIPALILTVIPLAAWFQNTVFEALWPIIFILAGIALVIWGRREKPDSQSTTFQDDTLNSIQEEQEKNDSV